MNDWFLKIDKESQNALLRISGSLNLPMPNEYENQAHMLTDIYHKIIKCNALITQAKNILEGR